MIKTVKDSTSVPDPGMDRRRRSDLLEAPERRAAESADAVAGEPDLRLVIEPDESGRDYIYKLINRTTGVEVARLTRAQVARLGEGAAYTAGTVIRTRA